MPFWKCYYHITWTTKYRQPLITPQIETIVFAAIEQKAIELNSEILALNGVEDHVHIAVCIPPRVSISHWIGQVKGAASHAVNIALESQPLPFHWQDGYGVLTFGARNLPTVVDYITHQKEHHAAGRIQPYLEQSDDAS